jgi:uroporphyrinogen-III synthase
MRGAVVALAALDLATFGTERVETAGKNKLDRELVRALKERTESTRRVIIRTPPGGRDRVKDKLRIRGQVASGLASMR